MVEVQTGYEVWIKERQEKARQEGRRYLAEVDFGVNWKIHGEPWETWRVSWIESTGELYAYGSDDRFVVHPLKFETEEEVREHLRQNYKDLYDNHRLESVFPLAPQTV